MSCDWCAQNKDINLHSSHEELVRFLDRQIFKIMQQGDSNEIKKYSFYHSLFVFDIPMAANVQKDENNLCHKQRKSIVIKSFFPILLI